MSSDPEPEPGKIIFAFPVYAVAMSSAPLTTEVKLDDPKIVLGFVGRPGADGGTEKAILIYTDEAGADEFVRSLRADHHAALVPLPDAAEFALFLNEAAANGFAAVAFDAKPGASPRMISPLPEVIDTVTKSLKRKDTGG
jgi:hypothetical protein